MPDLIINKTIRGDYQLTDLHWQNISPEAKDLVTQLLQGDPDKRMSLTDAMNHPWIVERDKFKKYDGVNREVDNDGEMKQFK